MAAGLVLHRGGVKVNRSDLALVECPAPTETWFPVSHLTVANGIVDELRLGGYEIVREEWGLAGSGGERMFGVLDLKTSILGREETLAVGVRNSIDQSFALGYCAGSRTFVCDNLAFSSELVIKRKHTVNGYRNFSVRVHEAVASLEGHVDAQRERIVRWQGQKLDRATRDNLLLMALQSGLFPRRLMADIFEEQVDPEFKEFADGSVYAFFSNFTTVMRGRALKNLLEYSHATQQLTRAIERDVFGMQMIEAKATVVDSDE